MLFVWNTPQLESYRLRIKQIHNHSTTHQHFYTLYGDICPEWQKFWLLTLVLLQVTNGMTYILHFIITLKLNIGYFRRALIPISTGNIKLSFLSEINLNRCRYCIYEYYEQPTIVAARFKACTVFARSDAGIVDLNPTQVMDVWCVYVFILCLCSVFR
jgi:hypothetical protein